MKPTAELLQDILKEVTRLIGEDKVANYIPALANVPSSKLGIAVYTNEGEVFKAGDADEAFSIQSISKALSLTLAMRLYEQEEIWTRVGKEPSGQAFNSLIQLEMERFWFNLQESRADEERIWFSLFNELLISRSFCRAR